MRNTTIRVECPNCKAHVVINDDPRAQLAQKGDWIQSRCPEACDVEHLKVLDVTEE